MGFDPRRWRPSSGSRPLTSNVEQLLAENEALRREVRSLRLQLETVLQGEPVASSSWTAAASQPAGRRWPGTQRGERQRAATQGAGVGSPGREAAEVPHSRVTVGSSHGLSADLLERWGQAMARHPRWQELRIGPPGGLRALEAELRRHWWNPALSLEQELDRRSPGLGSELSEALRGPHCRWRWAVRAAFALHGPRTPEWLSEEPLRVVDELLQRIARLEGHAGADRRGTRTANHSGAAGGSPGTRSASGAARDPRATALELLGLEKGASVAAIKRAYRRLAKAHHPDLGGDAEAFHRLDAAYRSLL